MSKPVSIYYVPLQCLLKALRNSMFIAGVMTLTLVHADEYDDVNKLVRTGQLAQAEVKADVYLVSKPRDPQMRFLKGVIQTKSGNSSSAIATFTQLTSDYPELPEPYNNLAALYAGQSQFEEAKDALQMAIRTNPSYAVAYENLGDVYTRLASQTYSQALALDSKNTSVQPKLIILNSLLTPKVKAKTSQPTPAKTKLASAAPASTINKPLLVPALTQAATSKPASLEGTREADDHKLAIREYSDN
jgi:Flp pilus assembly protein TadD